MNKELMQRELDNLKRTYGIELDGLLQRAGSTKSNLEAGRVSDHDCFNMAATLQNMALLAGKIEQTQNVIRWMGAK